MSGKLHPKNMDSRRLTQQKKKGHGPGNTVGIEYTATGALFFNMQQNTVQYMFNLKPFKQSISSIK